MRTFVFALILLCLFSSTVLADGPKVSLTTNKGIIVIELDEAKAPVSGQEFSDL